MVPLKSAREAISETSATIDSTLRLVVDGPWCLVIAQNEQLP